MSSSVKVISSTTLYPSPSSDPSLSYDTKIPLTIFDKAAFDLNVSVLYVFQPPMPSNEAMKEGLLKALLHFPHLAGRLTTDEQGRPCIHLNNAGVRVIETYVPTTLVEQLPFNPNTDIEELFPPIEGFEEIMQIQLNSYACGGLVIGQTCHHHVADGQSMSSFYYAWAKLVREAGFASNKIDDQDPIILPYHDRASVAVPRSPLNAEFDHRSIEFRKSNKENVKSSSSIENLVVNFSVDFMAKLKMKVNEEISNCTKNSLPPHRMYTTTFECLLAHVWKKVTQARGLEPDEFTQVRVAVNGRARMKPTVPMEYFGNLVLWAYPRLQVKELLQENYAYVARAIHEAVARVDNNYFKSFIDFGESAAEEDGGEKLVAMASDIGSLLCPNLEVDSWLRFQFHHMDFGGGSPCAVLPAELPVEGLVIFVPSCKEGGGIDAVMALQHEHVQVFKDICHLY